MYGIPRNTDCGFLVGKELIQVCYGRFQLALHFTEIHTVSVEGDYEICIPSRGGQTTGRFSAANPHPASINCVSFLGRTVVAVEILDTRTLIIRFTGDASITLYDSNKDFESFQIESPQQHLII